MPQVQTNNFSHFISFVCIVTLAIGTGYILSPNDHIKIKYYYSILLSLLFLTRFYSFYRKDWLLYLFEMCYIVNFVSIFIVPLNYGLELIYPFMHGPLAGYSLVYGDAIVFHDWDRTTSCAIHVLGGVITRRLYWNGDQALTHTLTELTLPVFFNHMKVSFLLYLVWAIPYTFLFLLPYNGKSTTMAKYVYRMKNDQTLTLKQKLEYIGYHMFFVNLAQIMGIFSMYCWQFNYFVVGCQIASGVINGGWYYYTGKRFNTKKFLSDMFFAVKNHVEINSKTLTVDVKIKDKEGTSEHVRITPLQLPKIINKENTSNDRKKDN